MASLNKVFLIGNLTKDPDLRYTAAGSAVADLRLAVSRIFMTKNGEKKEEVCFVSIVVWGKQAESCGTYLKKGAPVFIEGRLQLDSWETTEGEKRNRLRVQAERVQFLPRREGGGHPSETVKDIPEATAEVIHEEEDDIPF